MLRTIRTNFDRDEMRRDRRYPIPPVTVVLAQGEYSSLNWSLSGFILADDPGCDLGAVLSAKLRVADGDHAYDVQVEVVRREREPRATAFRFVEPTLDLVAALDRSLAQRMAGRRRSKAGPAALLLAAGVWALGAGAALAAGTTTTVSGTDGGNLVRGGAPLPQFSLSFPTGTLGGTDYRSPSERDLDISLTSPDKGELHFTFSPRPQFGLTLDQMTGTSRSFAGLNWTVTSSDGLYGSLGFSGSLTRPGAEEMNRSSFGPPVQMHGTLELGYQLGAQHSLSLSLDRARAPDLTTDRGELGDNLRLRYGLKF